MTEFDQTALDWMRETITDTLPDRATLYIPVYTSDDGGGQSVIWQMVADDVPCRVMPTRSNGDAWSAFGDTLQITPTYRAVLQYDAPVRADMRVVIHDVAYRIIQFSDAHSAKLVVHVVLAGE